MATLEGKRIAILGGTSGIGYAVAKTSLLSRAEHVFVASSSPDKVKSAVSRLCAEPALQTLHSDLPERITGEVVNMENTDTVKEFFDKIGEIDHLIITSGRFTGRQVDVKTSDLDQARCFLLHKPRAGASIVASVLGAVDAFTRALAVELAPIRVNVVCPGAVLTEMWDAMPTEKKQVMLKDLAGKLPVRHVASPDEVAEAYLFLMKYV
ncbi:hypothetical protein EIP86_011551 [Pleurotus ostreatoroseus]|nr:hypothetical protein EIP86_011551 [Pleurotus ostreatoroseus]